MSGVAFRRLFHEPQFPSKETKYLRHEVRYTALDFATFFYLQTQTQPAQPSEPRTLQYPDSSVHELYTDQYVVSFYYTYPYVIPLCFHFPFVY
jgi:hypothetical protein